VFKLKSHLLVMIFSYESTTPFVHFAIAYRKQCDYVTDKVYKLFPRE